MLRIKVTEGVKKVWKNDLFRTLIFMAIIILGIFAFRTALIIILKTNYPLQTPISESMKPTLNVGDLLIVQGIQNASEIKADEKDGDIIVFKNPGNPQKFIVHRAIAKFVINGKYYFITKGDNNRSADYWSGFPRGAVPEDYIIGKVIFRIPFLGYIKLYFGTPMGMALGILIIAAILILGNIPSQKSEM